MVIWMLGVTNSYTMEASFGGSTSGSRNMTHFATTVKTKENKFYSFKFLLYFECFKQPILIQHSLFPLFIHFSDCLSQDYEHVGRAFCETLLDYSDENPVKVKRNEKLRARIKKIRKRERRQRKQIKQQKKATKKAQNENCPNSEENCHMQTVK